jgi:hypothetical protein
MLLVVVLAVDIDFHEIQRRYVTANVGIMAMQELWI